MYGNFPQRAFMAAIQDKRRVSWPLLRFLRSSSEVMPENLCQMLGLPAGSSYSQGAVRFEETNKGPAKSSL